eukprot:844992_1
MATKKRGLKNQGATCYLNTMLQIMYSIDEYNHSQLYATIMLHQPTQLYVNNCLVVIVQYPCTECVYSYRELTMQTNGAVYWQWHVLCVRNDPPEPNGLHTHKPIACQLSMLD